MYFGTEDREVLPRWRSYKATVRTRELNALPVRDGLPRPTRDDVEVDLLKAEWRENRTPSYAADLLAAAIVLGDDSLVAEAAAAIRDFGDRVPLLGRRVAEHAALAAGSAVAGDADQNDPHDNLQPRIASVRRRLQRDQRNAIAWTELARFHAITGNRIPARRAMTVATGLAPDNRFILRSATRLAVHLGEPDWGQHLLRTSPRVRLDPWLTAAEISVSALTGRSSTLIKLGREMLSSERFSDFDLAELAATLGTREMQTSRKRAKRLFQQALQDPTENAVAQAVWARRDVEWLHIDPELMELPDSYEARARALATSGDRASAVNETWHWMNDEPFAIQPPAFGSYHASVGEEYDDGIRIAVAGLTANPNDFTLLNNATFCFANAGQIDEAQRYFARIKLGDLKDEDSRAVYFATRGLLGYRRGSIEEGRRSYRDALEATKDLSIRATAAIIFAREEVLAGTDLVSEITDEAFKLEEAARREGGVIAGDVRAWLIQLQTLLKETGPSKTARQRRRHEALSRGAH